MTTPSTAAAHVFVPDLGDPRLDEDDRRHLTRVLRLRAGAPVTVADGLGGWRPCRLGTGGSLEPTGEVQVEVTREPALTVAFALVKGQRPDLVVQKLTELGVDRIVPFAADRSVVRWDPAKAERQAERFAVIARQASSQCRRRRLPAIGLPDQGLAETDLPGFPDVAGLPGAVVADPAGDPPGPEVSTVLIGPEGGWSPTEAEARLPKVRLGEHVLRAETAAITAGALLVALRSDIVASPVSSQVATAPRF